jgi:hypothetical protein
MNPYEQQAAANRQTVAVLELVLVMLKQQRDLCIGTAKHPDLKTNEAFKRGYQAGLSEAIAELQQEIDLVKKIYPETERED